MNEGILNSVQYFNPIFNFYLAQNQMKNHCKKSTQQTHNNNNNYSNFTAASHIFVFLQWSLLLTRIYEQILHLTIASLFYSVDDRILRWLATSTGHDSHCIEVSSYWGEYLLNH